MHVVAHTAPLHPKPPHDVICCEQPPEPSHAPTAVTVPPEQLACPHDVLLLGYWQAPVPAVHTVAPHVSPTLVHVVAQQYPPRHEPLAHSLFAVH